VTQINTSKDTPTKNRNNEYKPINMPITPKLFIKIIPLFNKIIIPKIEIKKKYLVLLLELLWSR